MSMRNHLILVVVLGLLTACSSANVQSAVQSNDHHMSCAALEDEIQRMEANRSDDDSTLNLLGGAVRGAMSMSGVLPLAIAANVVKDQPDASEKRQGHLMTLYVSRGCNGGGHTQMVMTQPAAAPVAQVIYAYQPAAVVYEETIPHYESQHAQYEPQREVVQEQAPRYSAEHVRMSSYLFE